MTLDPESLITLKRLAKSKGITTEAMGGFIAGITFMTFWMGTPDSEKVLTEQEWMEQCLDLLLPGALEGSPFD